MSKNQDKVTRFLLANDWDNIHIAAAEGNMETESGFRTTAINKAEGAVGLCQWEGGRRTNLQRFAKGRGEKETDIGAQLNFLLHELDGSESDARDKFFAATTVKTAATAWQQYFERSTKDSLPDRIANAEAIYKTLKPTSKPAPVKPKPKTPVAISGRTYEVQDGDTLSGIASRYKISWQSLYTANRTLIGGDPNVIQAGMVLHVPNTRGEISTVTVTAGDTLTSIARTHGVANWQALYDKNRDVIGSDPDKITPGEVLVLP